MTTDEKVILEAGGGLVMETTSRVVLDLTLGSRAVLESVGCVVEETVERDEKGVLYLTRRVLLPTPLKFVSLKFSV